MGFRSYAALPAPALAVRHWAAAGGEGTKSPAARAAAGVVLDAGFSFTHAAPVFDGRVLPSGVRRINLGGKALTNYLKELVSYRRDSGWLASFQIRSCGGCAAGCKPCRWNAVCGRVALLDP